MVITVPEPEWVASLRPSHSTMSSSPFSARARASIAALSALAALAGTIQAQVSRTYTSNADFAEGVLDQVNFTAVADQLQLDTLPTPPNFPFVCVSVQTSPSLADGTVVRIDANTGQVLGEYRTAPEPRATHPWGIAVDAQGNVWVTNEGEEGTVGGIPKGSIVKVGIVLGGTRVDANGAPNPNGEYLAPPFDYSTAVDRDGDGLIHTSRGLGDVLGWPDVTDGQGGADGIVQDALDETILVYQRTNCRRAIHVSIAPNNDVWVGGYRFTQTPEPFDRIRNGDGAILGTVSTSCGGLAGLVDGNGVLWSTGVSDSVTGRLLRMDTGSLASTCITLPFPNGIAIDNNGFLWVTQLPGPLIQKIDPAGNIAATFNTPAPRGQNRTLAVSPIDNDVWLASQSPSLLRRFDNSTFALKKTIPLSPAGDSPIGVSVDANGKVWVVSNSDGAALRIDPNGDVDGLGAIDLTVSVGGPASSPFNYGDMTGDVPVGASQPDGSWTVIFDSGTFQTEFGRISYNAATPAQTALAAEFRTANTVAALNNVAYQPVQNGTAFSGVFGRFMQVRVNFSRANPQVTATPQLFDLTIESLPGGPVAECDPGQRYPGSLLVFPEFDNRRGKSTILTITNTAEEGDPVKVELVYIGRYDAQDHLIPCLEFNRTELMTPNDTLTLFTKTHNPNQAQGYVYAFAKDRISGQAIVYDHLAGNAFLMDGASLTTSAHNPEVFSGVGPEGTETDHDLDGLRDLNSLEYSCSPDEILVPRFLGQGSVVSSELILINLTGGAAFTATIDLLVYNDNEEAFSAQTSVQCWSRRPLHEITAAFDNAFLLGTSQNPQEDVGLETGWFRMNGNMASSSATSIPDPAFLALLVERTAGTGGAADLPFINGGQINGDLLSHNVQGDTTP